MEIKVQLEIYFSDAWVLKREKGILFNYIATIECVL